MKKEKGKETLKYLLLLLPFLCLSCSPYKKFLYRQALIDTLNIRIKKIEKENKKAIEELKADILLDLSKINNRLEEIYALLEETQQEIYKVRRREKEETIVFDETKAEEIYQLGYQDMISGAYQSAIISFKNFLQKYPNSELADNAQYWIGECYYAQGEQEKAIIELEKVLNNYPQGNKVSSSIYKLGLIYLNKKNKNRAKEYFQRLIKEYPLSNEARLAKERLKEF